VSDHLRPEEISALLRLDLAPDRAREATAHLLRCSACMEAAFQDTSSPDPEPSPDEASYDAVIDRALERARRSIFKVDGDRVAVERVVTTLEAEGLEGLDRLPEEVGKLAVYEGLLARSWALRHEDPAQMAQLAWLAHELAGRLDPVRHGPKERIDLRCRAGAELANAYRAMDRLDLADQTLERALRLYSEGTGDRLLGIRLLDLQASLAACRRRFGFATHALAVVHKFYRRHGDLHLAGRALVSQGLYTGYAGEPEKAIQLLAQGLELIDESRDPNLPAMAIHNQLCFMVDCGYFREAGKLLFRNQARLQAGDHINQLKVKWLGGRIEVGLKQLSRAETIFAEVREGLEAAGLDFHAALAAMDLATVLMAQNRVHEAQAQVEAAGQVFIALRIPREALAAILMLQKAFERQAATLEIMAEVTAFLRRIEIDPEARFAPRPA
jgi:tetratricopeptide (TPR) repeat protein